jgi:PAS domain S-box-containing protein
MTPIGKPERTKRGGGRKAVGESGSLFAISISENEWRALIIGSTLAVLLLSVYCLSNGITTIFMHLYYFPIVLLAYHYRMKGAVLATLLSVAYVALVIAYSYGESEVIAGAFYRFIVFIAIAAVVGFLSEQLFRVQQSLKESADIREQYISLAPAIILVLDKEANITHLNQNGCILLGCSFEKARGISWIDTFIPEESRNRIRQAFQRIITGDFEPFREVEHEIITLSGAVRIIRWHNTVLTDKSGAITGTLSYGEDITEKKRDEEIIHNLQQFQEGIITNANVWITVLSPKGKILVWNNAAETISGYKKYEALGTAGIWKRLYPDPVYRKWVTNEITRVITRDSYLEDFESEIQCRDGTKKTIAWNTKGLRNARGEIESYIAVGRDVTGARRAQDAIAASEEKYRTLVERISDVIYSLDGHGVITYISPAIEQISGYSPSEIMGREFKQFIFSDDLPQVKEIFEDGKDGSVKSFQFRIVNKSGEIRWLRSSSEPVEENGVFFGMNGVIVDISEQKRSEDALQKNQSLLSNAMDLAHMASWEFDVGTGIFTFDDRFYALYRTTAEREGGYQMPAEVYAREFVHPDERALVGEEVRKAIETSDPEYTTQIEHRIIRRDGAVRDILVRIGITKDSEGRTIRTHGANQDITEQRQAEEALRESEKRYRDLFNNANDIIVVHDLTPEMRPGALVDVNDRACSTLGYTREELLSLTLQDITDNQSPEEIATIARDLFKTGSTTFIGALKTKEGDTIPVEVSAHLFGKDHKQFNISIIRDITERRHAELELKKLASIVEHSGEFIGLSTLDGEIVFMNNAGARMIGVNPEDVQSHNLNEYIPENLADTIRNEVFPTILKKGSWEGDLQFRNITTGQLVDVHSMTFVINDPATGAPLYMANVSIDITGRKRAEEDLRKSNNMNVSLIEVIPDMIFILSEKGEFIDFRGGANTELYVDPDQFLGRTIDEILPPDIASLIHRKMQDVQSTGDIQTFEYTLDIGGIRNYQARMTRFGQTQFFCIIQDITERKKMEVALRESEEKYRAYIENAVESIFIADKNGTYLDVNPSACRLVGYSRDELLSLSIPDLVDPDDPEPALAGFNTLLKEGRMVQEVSLKRKDRSLVPVILNAVVLPDGNLMAFCTDITARKMTEDALALASRKLNLLSSITRHDILNQLMVLIGYLDMALEDVTDPEQRQFMVVEMQAAKTIQRQIEFTREYQELGLQAPIWLNINKSLNQAAINLPMRDVTVSIDRTDLEVYADRLLEKVFYNLIDNALRYGGERMTSISVSSHEEEGGLVIVFEDNGAGISAEDKPKLFTRGFGKNTGLGLFLSREILAITGITIEETGEPGIGARFEIRVPKGMYRFTGGNSTGTNS